MIGMTADQWPKTNELEVTVDRLVPGNLARLVQKLLHDGLPEQPLGLEF